MKGEELRSAGGGAARALLLALAACPATSLSPSADAQPGTAFQTCGDFPVSVEGHTAILDVTIPRGDGSLFLRVRALPLDAPSRPAHCFQLDSVSDSAGRVWVPPAVARADWGPFCQTCAQRVQIGHGYGFFGFPNNGFALPSAMAVHVRVALRSCSTLLPLDPTLDAPPPAAVRVDVLHVPPAPPSNLGHLPLALAFAAGGQFRRDSLGRNATLTDGLGSLQEAYGRAGILPEVVEAFDFSPPSRRVVFSSEDQRSLDDLWEAARDATRGHDPRRILVVFSPCLTQADPIHRATAYPDGFTPHIPGGFGEDGHADAVFVRNAPCTTGANVNYWLGGRLLGKVLQHEIGHYLGLYHTVEADGTLDHLTDTGPENILFWEPLNEHAHDFSPQQVVVMRGHPFVHY
jgi:hypothetical protein